MKPAPTDNNPLPHRWRNLLPRTGLSIGQFQTVNIVAHQRLPPAPDRPSLGLPLAVRVLLVLIHLRTNLTTRAVAALIGRSQSAVDPIIHHLVPVLARTLRPAPDSSNHPWIIDGTLIPGHDQAITAISKNCRGSVNTQIIICAHRRRVVVAGRCWPGNRNDVIVARTVVRLLDGRFVISDGGYRGITSITTRRRDTTSRIIRDDHHRAHRRIRARVERVIVRLKDWQMLGQCRRRGEAINHSLQTIAGLWNLETATNYGST